MLAFVVQALVRKLLASWLRRRAKQRSASPLTPTAYTTKHPTQTHTMYISVCFCLQQFRHIVNKRAVSGNSSESSNATVFLSTAGVCRGQDIPTAKDLRLPPLRQTRYQQACLKRGSTPIRLYRRRDLLSAQLDLRHRPDFAPLITYRTCSDAVEPILHPPQSSRLIRLRRPTTP